LLDTAVGALTPPYMMGTPALILEVTQILDRAPDRPDRFNEIISQHNGEGAISYFLGMLMIDPNRMPAVNLLIRVARRIGEHISMCLKAEFRCPRPSQLCSAIVPMIDPPATPSFPSGHSLQAQLIAQCLLAAAPPMRPLHLVTDLAARIGENRIIAGIHYPQDHLVGQQVANWCSNQMLNSVAAAGKLPEYTKLVQAAKTQLEMLFGAYGADQP
jgi:acid phosphatase (class A)